MIASLVAVLGAAYGAHWLMDRYVGAAGNGVPAEEDRMPEGRWHRASRPVLHDPAEQARLLSLPYMAGRIAATEVFGVRVFDPERSAPGVNLYTSGHGPEAILMDSGGDVLHRWSLPFEEAFPDRRATGSARFFRRAWLLDDGDLIVLFQEGGLARLAPDSSLRWALPVPAYNHVFVDHAGDIWTLTKQAVKRPEVRQGGVILEDRLLRVSPRGRVLDEISLLDSLLGSELAHLLDPLPEHEDIFHSNTVTVLASDRLGHQGLLRRGHVLVSLREVDLVAILDPAGPTVLWARRGPWRRQHQPLLLESGNLVLFDNRGFQGRARVVEFSIAEDAIVWQFPPEGAEPLYSPEGGSVQVLANGNLLVTESESGRALEITREGDLVWEFMSPHRAGRGDELVATLWEVLRLEPPPEALEAILGARPAAR